MRLALAAAKYSAGHSPLSIVRSSELGHPTQAGQVEGGEGIPIEMMREMTILMSLRHPNIVAVREVVVDSSQASGSFSVQTKKNKRF